MLKMGIPLPAVKQALVKEGKDPGIIDMDPDKPLTKEVPLKDDSEYSKFFQVRNALISMSKQHYLFVEL
jgi:hypothetical protein